MENIDERDIDAARFERRISTIWRKYTAHSPEGGLRLAIFLLFTYLAEIRSRRFGPGGNSETTNDWLLPWSWGYTERLNGLQDAKQYANQWLNKQIGWNEIDSTWQSMPEEVLDLIRALVTDSDNPDVILRRLDYLVTSLVTLRDSNSWSRRLESFVADFSSGWAARDEIVLDLNTMSSGEIGVRQVNVDGDGIYLLPYDLPNMFEVCLRLHAHGVQYGFTSGLPELEELPRKVVVYKLSWRTQKRNLTERTKTTDGRHLWILGGFELTHEILFLRENPRIAIVVLPTADLRAKGLRVKARREVLYHQCVLGVVDIPARVSGSTRLSMLILEFGAPNRDRPVLLMNGRAVDGLRDESLSHLARFLSLPFMEAMMRERPSRRHHDEPLSDALLQRARKMYGSNSFEVPGFYRYVNPEKILEAEYAVLDPSQWITKRDPLVASDLLDGSPVYELLKEKERACCVYVIGNNGVGKSMLLRQLAKACGTSGRPVRAIASAPTDRFETSLGGDTDYIYLGARTSATSTQPRKLGGKLAELMIAIHADPDKVAAVNRVLEQLSFSGQHYLLPEVASSDFLESVRELGCDEAPSTINGWKLGFRKTHENTIIPFDHLSTGEQQLLLLTARLVEHARPGVVFLIDEPETSLHVAWQRALPSVFQTISRDFICQMVIATHSPILLSTSSGSDTFRFMADGGVLEPIGEQAASSVERVLFQGFDTYTGNNREVHERCAELVSQAIEYANTERTEMLSSVLEELRQMEETVTRSVPSLGTDVPASHLDLIRRATLAIADLASPKPSNGARS